MSIATSSATPPRERILRTAHDLFYRDGIRATGIDRVIAESGVAKATFYRQFPSKDDLVLAFLDFRHARWMAWFTEALARHGGTPAALAPALAEWLRSDDFRGCAFLNSVGELAASLPAVSERTRGHKQAMTAAIGRLLPAAPGRVRVARALALAVDGAIVQAQYLDAADAPIDALAAIVKALAGSGSPPGADPDARKRRNIRRHARKESIA